MVLGYFDWSKEKIEQKTDVNPLEKEAEKALMQFFGYE